MNYNWLRPFCFFQYNISNLETDWGAGRVDKKRNTHAYIIFLKFLEVLLSGYYKILSGYYIYYIYYLLLTIYTIYTIVLYILYIYNIYYYTIYTIVLL